MSESTYKPLIQKCADGMRSARISPDKKGEYHLPMNKEAYIDLHEHGLINYDNNGEYIKLKDGTTIRLEPM